MTVTPSPVRKEPGARPAGRRTACALLLLALVLGPAGGVRGRENAVTPDLDRAVVAGLGWLARNQTEEGCWPDNRGRETGVVGLALLAFLAHGETPDSSLFATTITRAVDYILRNQQANGLLSHGGSAMYNHGFATLALAEAYGVVDDERIGPALKRAVGLIQSAQNARGGWRYNVGSTDSDTTVTGAQMMALRGAASAGIEVPSEVVEKGVGFLKSCYCPGGGFGYTGPGGPNHARSGIGALVLSLTGHYRDPEVKATADWLLANLHSLSTSGSYGYYGAYYCSQAMYQAGGRYWRRWNSVVTPAILAAQRSDGSWMAGLGPSADTAFALLSIEINYDLLPIYQR